MASFAFPAVPQEPPLRWRQRLPAMAVVAYVATLAVASGGGREARGWVAALAALAVAGVAGGRVERAARAAGWGLALVFASVGAAHAARAFDAAGGLGLAVAAGAACVAIARAPSPGGVTAVAPVSPVLPTAGIALAWSLAIGARVAPSRAGALGEHPLLCTWVALAITAALMTASVELAARRRRLELGFVERATAMRALLGALSVGVVLVAALGGAPGEEAARSVLGVAAVLVTVAALEPDPVRVAQVARRTAVLATVGGCVAALGACAAVAAGDGAWAVTLVTAAAVLGVGAVAVRLEAPLRPGEGRWLDAFARAADEAVRAEPDHAIRGALLALRAPAGLEAPSPELWTLMPPRALAVDAAGYMRERDAEVPPALVELAEGEPEGAVCVDVLEALEVRRPDLRPLLRWMTDRHAMLATVAEDDGEAEGVLVLPHAGRPDRPSLEEVRALATVARRLAVACRARGTRERMFARVQEASARAEMAEQTIERLRHERDLDAGRDALAASRLARPATVGIYSAASRLALEALERRTAAGAPLAVVASTGVDPVPYLARAHLSGTRAKGPLVMVDATSAREHDPARWTDPATSPLALADRGMLVLLDGAALPGEVQRLLAQALSERRAPWGRPEPLDVQLALTGVASPDDLVEAGRLDPALAARLGDASPSPVRLPRLRDRPEDLRAVLTDRLAREGLRVLGRPVGIDHGAHVLLARYGFPGDDAELSAVVQRLVELVAVRDPTSGGAGAAAARGEGGDDVVRAEDVRRLGLQDAPAGRRKDPLSA